jgi:hypothetical protein
MEKKLERMRKEVRGRMWQTLVITVVMVALLIVVCSGVIPMRSGDQRAADFFAGFQMGLVMATTVVEVYYLVRYIRALTDEKKLKKLYYEEHDERKLYIEQISGQKSQHITVIILIVAAVLVGYYSIEAFIALVAAVAVICLVGIGVKIYYEKTVTGIEE